MKSYFVTDRSKAPSKKPYIGLNCIYKPINGAIYYQLDNLYIEAVRKTGGIPIMLPLFYNREECWEMLDRLDGLVFTGGPDINPSRWDEKKHPKTELLHKDKEKSDFILAENSLKRDMPILGVCGGLQLINVAMGGSLHQHIPDIIGKDNHSRGKIHKVVDIKAGSHLKEAMGINEATVKSYHHQAINRVGDGLDVTSFAEDGIIESIESKAHRFVLGVQWHPERMQDSKHQMTLFSELIKQSKS